jgi:hypothetical protein
MVATNPRRLTHRKAERDPLSLVAKGHVNELCQLLLERYDWIIEDEVSFYFGSPPWLDTAVPCVLAEIVRLADQCPIESHNAAAWIRKQASRAARRLEHKAIAGRIAIEVAGRDMTTTRAHIQKGFEGDLRVAKSANLAGILYRGTPPALAVRRGMDLRCTECNSADLKKASLAYREGLFKSKSRGRLLGLVFGSGGPGFVLGGTTAKGTHQSELSVLLAPPEKWSYLRLIFRFSIAVFVGFLAYVIFVIVSTPPVSSLPIKLLVFLAPIAFCALVFLTWRHNNLIYPPRFVRWDRSFICQRCGAVSQHEGP